MKCKDCPYFFTIQSMISYEDVDVCLLQLDKGENFQPVNYEYDHPTEGETCKLPFELDADEIKLVYLWPLRDLIENIKTKTGSTGGSD